MPSLTQFLCDPAPPPYLPHLLNCNPLNVTVSSLPTDPLAAAFPSLLGALVGAAVAMLVAWWRMGFDLRKQAKDDKVKARKALLEDLAELSHHAGTIHAQANNILHGPKVYAPSVAEAAIVSIKKKLWQLQLTADADDFWYASQVADRANALWKWMEKHQNDRKPERGDELQKLLDLAISDVRLSYAKNVGRQRPSPRREKWLVQRLRQAADRLEANG